MSFSEFSLFATLLACTAMFFVYCYLFMQYRRFYLGLWAFSWALHFIRFFYISTPLPEISFVPLSIYMLSAILGGIMMLLGTSQFVDRKLDNAWIYWGVIIALVSVYFAYLRLQAHLLLLPICIYLGCLYCKNGVLFIYYSGVRGLGKLITGFSFIILGLHLMDMPWLINVLWFAPWGFLIDATFRFIVAIGTLIVYFEKTRNELVEKEQSYRLLAENASDVIYRFHFNPYKHFDYISPSISKLTGYSPCDFYKSSKLALTLVHPSDRPLAKIFLRKFVDATDHLLSLRLVGQNNSVIWIEQKSVPIINESGVCIGFEGIIRDITERRQLEQDVYRLDRLNAVGQMAASVAHEIRNPMTTVRGYLQYFANKQEFTIYNKQFGLMIEELDRTNVIIKEYLALSQHRIIDLQILQLNSIIESLYPLIKADANATNKDITLLLESIPLLYLDEKEIRQLILNLVRNGLEAMAPGGIVTIRTYREQEEAVLAIEDEGSGIPQHILDDLGKPFQTTKDNGTGLGLAICYRIANRHQATIKVNSSTSGTTFSIYFKLPTNKL